MSLVLPAPCLVSLLDSPCREGGDHHVGKLQSQGHTLLFVTQLL